MAQDTDSPVSRRLSSSKESHSKMVDDAISALHALGPIPPQHRDLANTVMHTLLIGKHFVLNGQKVPEHLQDGPPKASEDSGDTSKPSGDDEEVDNGD